MLTTQWHPDTVCVGAECCETHRSSMQISTSSSCRITVMRSDGFWSRTSTRTRQNNITSTLLSHHCLSSSHEHHAPQTQLHASLKKTLYIPPTSAPSISKSRFILPFLYCSLSESRTNTPVQYASSSQQWLNYFWLKQCGSPTYIQYGHNMRISV